MLTKRLKNDKSNTTTESVVINCPVIICLSTHLCRITIIVIEEMTFISMKIIVTNKCFRQNQPANRLQNLVCNFRLYSDNAQCPCTETFC